jgi:dsRNA-specific ribonuclease
VCLIAALKTTLDSGDIFDEFLSRKIDILFTTTTRPLIHAVSQRHFALFQFDAIPNYPHLLDDLQALHADTQTTPEPRGSNSDSSVWGPWTSGPAGISACLYAVDLFRDGKHQMCRTGLLVPQPLPNVEPFYIYPPKVGPVCVSTRMLRTIDLVETDAFLVAQFNHWVATMLGGVDVNGDNRNLFLQPPRFSQFLPRYIVPMDSSHSKVDFRHLELICSRGHKYEPDPLWPASPEQLHRLQDEDTLVFTSFNHKICRFNGFHKLSFSSVPVTLKGGNATLPQYYSEKWKADNLDPTQPVINLMELQMRTRNVLAPRTIRDAESTDLPDAARVAYPVPLQLCHIHTMPARFYDALQYMPAICFRLENWIRADSVRHKYGLRSTSLVLEALTAPCTHEDFNYELSELVGDAFLKLAASSYVFSILPTAHEGDLTVERSKLIRNTYLAKLGQTSGIVEFLILDAFSAAKKPQHYGSSRIGAEAVVKPQADVVEAIVGAALRDEGFDAAMRVLADIGLDLSVDSLDGAPLPVPHDRMAALGILQRKLNYAFREEGLLQRALVHGTVIPNSNKRLEFLGDAVLDYLVLRILMDSTNFEFSQGEYTSARSSIVSNESLARTAMEKLGLASFVHHQVRTPSQLSKIADNISDYFEAVVGAIYIDCNRDLDVVWSSVGPLLRDAVSEACGQLRDGTIKVLLENQGIKVYQE